MASKGTQTMYTVYSDDDNAKVMCFKGTQTVTHIDVDEASPDKVEALLEFTPFSEIKENCLQIIDLPKHILKFATTPSAVSNTNGKSVLKHPSDVSIRKYEKTNAETVMTDDEAQTRLQVSPHLLGDDCLPTVVMEETTQTNFVTDYPEYKSKLSFYNIVQHQTIPGNDDYKSEHEESTYVRPTTSRISTLKFISTVDMTASKAEVKMMRTLERTVEKLQEQLERMHNEHGEVEEVINTDLSGMILGDSGVNKRTDILCECQCVGASGGAVPKLDQQCKPENNIKPENVRSWPDLIEHNIRLKKKIRCRCAKSDTNKSCVGYKADRVMIPKNSTAQSCCLLVDQDGDYADSYLEMLAQEQTGTQTEMEEIESDEYLITKPECKCTPAIEIPWELLTYDPKVKQKKTPCPEPPTPPPQPEESVEPSPSTLRLKQLTVEAMDEAKLLELTEDAIADTLGDEDLTLSEVERRIAKIENKDVRISSVVSVISEDSLNIRYPRLPPRKAKPNLVYEPSCERHNEPYMDRMYQYFPDDCEAMDACPSHIEMPWNAIVLPKNCNIRKQYKPEKCDPIKTNNCSTEPDFETSNNTKKHKKAQKTLPMHGSLSQPFMSTHRHLTIAEKKSDLVRVLNFTESKTDTKQRVSSTVTKKTSNTTPPSTSQAQRIKMLIDSCKKEMEPIREGINKLRHRIRELNLPDISSFQEIPQRPGQAYSGYSLSFSGPQMPYFTPPCWSPCYPYLPPYQFPRNYGGLSERKHRSRKSRSSKVRKTRSSSLTSSGADHSDLDSPVMENYVCKQSTDRNNCSSKKPRPSKIPKPIKKRDSEISKTETIGHRSSRSTNTSECGIEVAELYNGVKKRCSSNIIECGEINDVANGNLCSKESHIECGAYSCLQEMVENVTCAAKKKTVVRNKIAIDLNSFMPINKYRKPREEKSSITVPIGLEKNKSNSTPEKTEEDPECFKEGECD